MADDTPRSGTTAALDARVARLEKQFDLLDQKVDQLALQQERVMSEISHVGQLVQTQYQAVQAEINLSRTRYHEMANLMQTATSEPAATPAGRAINERMARYETAIDRLEKESERTRLWIAYGSGAVGVILLLANLFGPSIRAAVGLP